MQLIQLIKAYVFNSNPRSLSLLQPQSREYLCNSLIQIQNSGVIIE